MIRDRDRIYGAVVTRRLRAMGIRDKPIAPASPWQNGFAERLIGSIRRECLDHIIVLGEVHLRRMMKSYARYYNGFRTHRSLTAPHLDSTGQKRSFDRLPFLLACGRRIVMMLPWIRRERYRTLSHRVDAGAGR